MQVGHPVVGGRCKSCGQMVGRRSEWRSKGWLMFFLPTDDDDDNYNKKRVSAVYFH